MVVVLPIIVIVLLVLSLAMQYLISGIMDNGIAFGLPENSSAIPVFFAVTFGLITATLLATALLTTIRGRK